MQTQLQCEIPALGAAGDLKVYDFAGDEGLSQLFSFEVVAASTEEAIDLGDLIQQKAKVSLSVSTEGSGHQHRVFNGMVTDVTDWGEGFGEHYYFFYRLTVKPLVWQMTLHRRSRVIRQKNVPDIVKRVLEDNGFSEGPDFKFDLDDPSLYPLRDFTVQHNESDWDFLCRLLEDEGIFYYFIPNEDKQTVVFRDYNPEAGGDLDIGDVLLLPRATLGTDIVNLTSFTSRWRMTPGNVSLWDRDYEDFPSGTLEEKKPADGQAPDQFQDGVYEEYNERNKAPHTPAGYSGDAVDVENEIREDRTNRLRELAKRRKEEILSNQGKLYLGSGNQALFAHGSVFKLTTTELSTSRYEGNYLIKHVRHVGSARSQFRGLSFSQRSSDDIFAEAFTGLVKMITSDDDESGGMSGYVNSIRCIELATPYRPPRVTPKPRIPGVVPGKIERYPGDRLLDREGRYLVRLFFDEQDKPFQTEDNEPSRPIRKAQPSGGRDWGTHLVSEEGAEGLIAFMNGDPDEPVMVGTLSNMATHTPVPNTELGLGSENPDEQTWSDENRRISYDEKKNVVSTTVGHQLVMDDDTGQANVGITLQAGVTPSEGDGQADDVYWGSKSEYGGHRAKGAVEKDVDRKTQGVNGLGPDAPRPGALQGIVQSATADKDYWEDATSNVTPVGVQLFTNNRVELVGKNGLDIHAPNLANPSGGRGPENLDVDQNRGRVLGLSKFLTNALWRGVFKRLADFIQNSLGDKPGKYSGDVEAEPILKDVSDYDKKKVEKSQDAKAYKALRLPGIKMNAAGPLTMASYTSVDAVTGKGGFNVDSFGDITQRADLDASLEAGQLIKIRTVGKELQNPPLDAAANALKGELSESENTRRADDALKRVKDTLEQLFEAEGLSLEFFPVLIENEHGGIILHTEGKGATRDMGHIDSYAEEGDVRLRTKNEGKISAHSIKEISLIVEDQASVLGPFYDGKLFDESLGNASKIVMNPTNAECYAKEFIRLQTDADDKGNTNAPSIQIDTNQTITLQCGQSMIKLSSDGTIDIEGVNINITAMQNITEDAKMELKEKALNITSEAQIQQTVKGTLANVEATGILTEKGSMVMIN